MVPFHFSTDVLFYNHDWFEKGGEPMPDESWDWQKFAGVAARLAARRQNKIATVLPRPLLLVQSFGGVLFADGKCTVKSPETIAALQFYRDLVARGVAPTTAAMGEVEAFDGVNLFRDGKIPVLVGRTYMLTEFDHITVSGGMWRRSQRARCAGRGCPSAATACGVERNIRRKPRSLRDSIRRRAR